MLVWFGVGGQGKTALQGEFGRMLERWRGLAANTSRPAVAHAIVDFEPLDNRNIANALLSLRLQLQDSGDIAFRAFDQVYLRHFMLAQPGMDIRKVQPRLFGRHSEYLGDLVEVLGTLGDVGLPGFNLVAKYGARVFGQAADRMAEWWDVRGARLLHGIDEMTQDQLLRSLPMYLGADLCDALAAKKPPRIVIRFDTHEALFRDRVLRDGSGALRVDEWVRRLVQDAPGVLFAITGRDRLAWGDIDADWDQVLEQHLLGGLSAQDARHFLSKVGIDGRIIQDRIIEGAEGNLAPGDPGGCLPYYLDLQRETFEDIKAAGMAPRPEDFGGSHAQILARFLDHIGPEWQHALVLASYPQVIDATVMDRLAKVVPGGLAGVDWLPLFGRSVFEAQGDGRYTMHALMREALQAKERSARPEQHRQLHRLLFEAYASLCAEQDPRLLTSAHDAAFLAATHHLLADDELEAIHWSNSQLARFEAAAHWITIEVVCERLLPVAERILGEEDDRTRACVLWLGSAYREAGRYKQAESMFVRVRTIEERVLPADHADLASTLGSLAGLYRDTGRFGEAEALYERVRKIRARALGETHPNFAATLCNLAGLYQVTGRYGEAEALYERVREIEARALGETHPQFAATLGNLAGLYWVTGRYGEAEALYERVREVKARALGETHPQFAATLCNLAGLYQVTGRYGEAEALYERVREIQARALGETHPQFAATLGNLACLYQVTGRYGEAEALNERVREIEARALGETHPQFAATLGNLAGLYQATGRYGEAEALYERVREIRARALGETHPQFAATLGNLAGCQATRQTDPMTT